MKLTPETKTYIILGLTVACMVAIVLAIILPTVQRMENVRLDIDRMKDLLERRYAEAQRMNRANVTISTIKDQANFWENTLVTPQTELQFINFIEALAREKNIELKTKVVPEPSQKPLIKNILQLELGLTGTFPAIQDFLRALDQSDYYITTQTITIEISHSHTATAENPSIHASLKSFLYVY